jgi:hypothetical protein
LIIYCSSEILMVLVLTSSSVASVSLIHLGDDWVANAL